MSKGEEVDDAESWLSSYMAKPTPAWALPPLHFPATPTASLTYFE